MSLETASYCFTDAPKANGVRVDQKSRRLVGWVTCECPHGDRFNLRDLAFIAFLYNAQVAGDIDINFHAEGSIAPIKFLTVGPLMRGTRIIELPNKFWGVGISCRNVAVITDYWAGQCRTFQLSTTYYS